LPNSESPSGRDEPNYPESGQTDKNVWI